MAHKAKQDQITLAGIKLLPHIGTSPEERLCPTECRADLTVWGDFAPAAATDSLEKAVDYCRILSIAQQTAVAREYNLVETLTQRIARAVLQSFPVSRVRVRLRKTPASLAEQVDYVEVEMEES